MSNEQSLDKERRNALVATGVVGGVGALCTAWPFVNTFAPSERAKAAGGPVEVDISAIKEGEMIVAEWQGKPVWILKRSPEMMSALKQSVDMLVDPDSKRMPEPNWTPAYCQNEFRAREDHKDVFVCVGICTHLGCSPQGPFGVGANPALLNDEGFVCPCHGSVFDLAGRVWKNKPAPDNLRVPPYKFTTPTKLLIGDDGTKGA
ncbi:MAG TPA: ubiquinol-cytochrome c reductase iron-sulfur subunit [Burkholderiales bacterium]|jgi:ubiquinol-cytochrome c reductase iron-sulfur subunit